MQKTVLTTTTSYQFFAKKNAPTIILLHGWLQDWQSWSPLLHSLSEKYQIVIPDLPAFGASTFDLEQTTDTENTVTAWNTDSYAQWLAAFIESLSLSADQPLFIGGHSFGGKIAAVAAATYAKTTKPRIAGIILIAASGLPDPLSTKSTIKQNLIALIPDIVKNSLPAGVKSKVLGKLNLATDHLQSTPQQRAILKRIVRENIAQSLNAIAIPTLLVWGKNDTSTPLHQGYAFHVAIRDAQLVVCNKSGHFPFIDEPKLVTEAITTFVSETINKAKQK